MARFFVPADTWDPGELPESEARHSSQVLRLGEGDKAVIFDGTGRVAEVELCDMRKKHAGFRVLREWREERSRPEIHLIVALIKNERFDWLEIFPVSSLPGAFGAAPEGLKAIPALHPGGKSLGECFVEDAPSVTFAIGPEGDWAEEEMRDASSAGFVPVNLGRHVLRSETAALHVLSAAAHRYHGGVGGL